MKKTIALIITLVILLLSLCSCLDGAKEVTLGDLSITLKSKYISVDGTDKGYDAVYTSTEGIVVSVMKESFSSLEGKVVDGQSSAVEYTEAVLDLYDQPDLSVSYEGANPCISYTEDVNSIPYTYFIYILKGADSFFRVQLALPTEDLSEKAADLEAISESLRIKQE